MKKTQKGITLVALIITIIVLLILAAVAIGAVQNDGIIEYAKKSRDKYEQAQINEKTELDRYENFLNNYWVEDTNDVKDTVAPTIEITDYFGGSDYITIDIELTNVTQNDYPITIEYYRKLASADDTTYYKEYSTIITEGTTVSGGYEDLSMASSYMLKIVVTDSVGNSDYVTQSAGTSCFLAGTKVLTETGLKNIEDIKIGDKVYSINMNSREKELKEVTYIFNGKTDETYELTVGEETIKTTPKHQFFVIDKGWVRAYDLQEGDLILSEESERLPISKIEHKFHKETLQIYNLTVAENHNYLITEHELLVHNAPGGFIPSITPKPDLTI